MWSPCRSTWKGDVLEKGLITVVDPERPVVDLQVMPEYFLGGSLFPEITVCAIGKNMAERPGRMFRNHVNF